jgi:hypothetical protein
MKQIERIEARLTTTKEKVSELRGPMSSKQSRPI